MTWKKSYYAKLVHTSEIRTSGDRTSRGHPVPWIFEIKNLKEKTLLWYFDSKIGRKNHSWQNSKLY